MNLIITAGGTRERIDSVRTITNEATGRLGSLIANEFSQRLMGTEHMIYYVCGMNAAVPEEIGLDVDIIRIEGTDDLIRVMTELLTMKKIDAVIHSMAVSDYKVCSVTTLEQTAQVMYQGIGGKLPTDSYEEWQTALEKAIRIQSLEVQSKANAMNQKISSDLKQPLLLLEKTPKVINMIKKISPQSQLVGFKLLSNISRDKLIDTAYNLLKLNDCDYVLANDTAEINEREHKGYLVNKDGTYQEYNGKEQIAEGIASNVLSHYNQ